MTEFSDFKIGDFKSHGVSFAETWTGLMLNEKFQEASELCDDFIEKYKTRFQERTIAIEDDAYDDLRMVLVFVKGLADYVRLSQITYSENWYESNDALESAWLKLCDCRDRLAFSSQLCRGRALELVSHSLDKIEEFYLYNFGKGSYASPGIEADGGLCSICSQDFRACSHVPGRLYEGVFCTCKLINPSINHIALVDTPKDFRCRIWPWHLEKNQDEGVNARMPILFAFSVDDFLEEASS